MSRVPRAQEYLKTGFTSEAVAAARFRAYAARAEQDGKPKLAESWRELARAKDSLAVKMLDAAGQVRDGARADAAAALGEERFENEVLYPKMTRQIEGEPARVLAEVSAEQARHLEALTELRGRLQATTGDLG